MRADLRTTVATYGILSLAGTLAFVLPDSIASRVLHADAPTPVADTSPAPPATARPMPVAAASADPHPLECTVAMAEVAMDDAATP